MLEIMEFIDGLSDTYFFIFFCCNLFAYDVYCKVFRGRLNAKNLDYNFDFVQRESFKSNMEMVEQMTTILIVLAFMIAIPLALFISAGAALAFIEICGEAKEELNGGKDE